MNGLRRLKAALEPGFTLIEMLAANLIVTILVVAALSLYSRSNKTAADQQQYTQLQQDVRAAMYYVDRDVRMAGTGLPDDFRAASLEGTDNESQGGGVLPDRLKIMGNIDLPFQETLVSLNASTLTANLSDYSLNHYSLSDSDYIGRIVLFLPVPGSACANTPLREITGAARQADGTSVFLNFTLGRAQSINPPGGLSSMCDDSSYAGGTVMFADVHEFWLDVTGNISGLTAGENGYIGGGTGGVLYMTNNGVHCAIAQNIEDLQFRYNGDLDADGNLDGFADWNASWTVAQRARIREVCIWVLGRTPDRFANIPAFASRNTYLYRRPLVANSAAATSDDWHRRFLLESTANIRNMSLDIYNKDQR
jgi:prepilin-type N-terminal cleavage/methylation domain-containing protein